MIDFATLKGLTVPEGVVVKIESGGVVMWELQTGGTVVLEVEKITATTYAGSTTYNNESFILLDIYPKSGGTVSVTYGGLTKTITDDGTSEEPNAQQVFFGTFNGVADEVETPVSGTLTIDGDYVAFGVGGYKTSSKGTALTYYSGITRVVDFGTIGYVPNYAFYENINLVTCELPKGIKSIGDNAFAYCEKINITEIPEGVETIGISAFQMSTYKGDAVTEIETITLPSTLKSIGNKAFARYDSEYYCIVECVTTLATTPPDIGSATFGDYANFTIIVPIGCGEAYKAAEGWSTYADYIMEASE
jgi:hypothetical protein